MANNGVKLYGRAFLKGEIHALSGLHVGGATGGLEIGGVDMPVIRDAFGVPYVPGSSLKGKMRSLWEKWNGAPQNRRIGRGVNIHVCQTREDYIACPVCPIYGTEGQTEASAPTRITVRDVPLDTNSLAEATTDLPYAEVKWEVAIDRVTSAAVPRQMARVPSGAIFRQPDGDAAELLAFSFYEAGDVARFGDMLTALQLLEDDYLGGQGSRGSGQVAFRNLTVICKGKDYDHPREIGQGDTLQELLDKKQEMATKLRELLAFDSET